VTPTANMVGILAGVRADVKALQSFLIEYIVVTLKGVGMRSESGFGVRRKIGNAEAEEGVL